VVVPRDAGQPDGRAEQHDEEHRADPGERAAAEQREQGQFEHGGRHADLVEFGPAAGTLHGVPDEQTHQQQHGRSPPGAPGRGTHRQPGRRRARAQKRDGQRDRRRRAERQRQVHDGDRDEQPDRPAAHLVGIPPAAAQAQRPRLAEAGVPGDDAPHLDAEQGRHRR
jgi:hypothetical protein